MTWGGAKRREGLALNEADLGVTGELQKDFINFFKWDTLASFWP